MFKLISLALVALAAVSTVNAVAIFPRKTPPTGWIAEILEPYDDYNTRYTAIGCQNKHNTQFFDDCCHPMKKGETLENNRKPYCRPGSSPVPSSTPATVSPHVKTLGVEPTSTSSQSPNPVLFPTMVTTMTTTTMMVTTRTVKTNPTILPSPPLPIPPNQLPTLVPVPVPRSRLPLRSQLPPLPRFHLSPRLPRLPSRILPLRLTPVDTLLGSLRMVTPVPVASRTLTTTLLLPSTTVSMGTSVQSPSTVAIRSGSPGRASLLMSPWRTPARPATTLPRLTSPWPLSKPSPLLMSDYSLASLGNCSKRASYLSLISFLFSLFFISS